MTAGQNSQRFRFYTEQLIAFVDVDYEKRLIRSVELEGEQPLLVISPTHKTATLWLVYEDLSDEYQFDADDYSCEEELGVTHMWKWYDENGNAVLRVVAHYPAESEEDDVAQVVVNLEDQDGLVQMNGSLFMFMTDFKGWTLAETYGKVTDALTALGRYFSKVRQEEQ